jgi:uncharacterized metal-binding protein (TIGR02443 family)
MKIKKRFIAAAQCPQCKDTDSLRWWEENRVEWVECVSCDFKEQRLPAEQEKAVGAQDMIGIFKPE